MKFLPPRRDRDETLQNFPHETRPRRDHPIKLERDRDETESLGALSLETETRPRLSSFTGGSTVIVVLSSWTQFLNNMIMYKVLEYNYVYLTELK